MSSRTWTGLAPALAALALFGCNVGDSEPPPSAPEERARVHQVSMELDMQTVSTAALRAAVADAGGYVQSASAEDEHATVVARVPVDALGAFRRAVRELGEVTRETEQVADVSAERTDGAARLRNARRQEERLLALMDERTASLADVIAVEAQLAEVRERVEVLESEERALTHRIELAEITIALRRTDSPFWHAPGATLMEAGRFGLRAAAAATVAIGAVMAAMTPIALIFAFMIGLAILSLRTIARRRARA